MDFTEKEREWIKDHRDLIESKDFLKIWEEVNKGVPSPSFINEAFIRLGLNPLEGLSRIPMFYFMGTKITNITIPNSVKTIGDGAFRNCYSLKEVILPNPIYSIKDEAFSGCTNLVKVTIDKSLTRIVPKRYNSSMETNSFYNCISLKSVEIPEGIADLSWGAFQSCEFLTRVDLSKNIRFINCDAFTGCHNLRDLYYPGTTKDCKEIEIYGRSETKLNKIIHCSDGDIEL